MLHLPRCRWREAFLRGDIDMPRPKKTTAERRCRQVIFRLTDAEFQRLSDKADRAGIAPNDLARQLTTKAGKSLVIKTSQRCDPAYLKRIDQIGHNLNQIVKNAHIFGTVSPRLETLCQHIRQIIDEALEEVSGDT